jgi:hypothetical protein
MTLLRRDVHPARARRGPECGQKPVSLTMNESLRVKGRASYRRNSLTEGRLISAAGATRSSSDSSA